MMTKEKCVHYWIIESPKGKMSKAVCKKCGAKTQMVNYCDGAYAVNHYNGSDITKINQARKIDRLRTWG